MWWALGISTLVVLIVAAGFGLWVHKIYEATKSGKRHYDD